jgi:hypothetical protein
MAWQILNSVIEIVSTVAGVGTLRFSGVHEVQIKKGIYTINQSAMVKLPALSTIKYDGSTLPKQEVTGNLFNDRDKISIKLGYNGNLVEEFRGFVKRRDMQMPLVVECEGYEQQLRLDVSVSKSFSKTKTTAKDLLQLACKGTDVTVRCDVNVPLQGITLVKADGVRIVDYIKQACEGVLTIFFIEPTVLYCGLVYNAYATASSAGTVLGLGVAKYRIGFNCPRRDELKRRVPSEPVQIILQGKYATAVQVFTESKAAYAKRKVVSLNNHVPDKELLGRIAQEKEYRANYTGFDGKLTTFLEPYAVPGYDAYIMDDRYPELEGYYIIEGMTLTYGLNGARRVLDIGPKVGFGKV